ncbi:MAG: hypothetical protein CMJ64_13715 [Planctomycetaceae bacterium]|nr:hypothetical protein [Planctomycetaceae bacterium]
MFELLAAAVHNRLWYAIPLIVAVSLVYGATRHELMGPILNNALRAAVWIVSFMSIIFGILYVISWAI